MATGDHYRKLAAEFEARANSEAKASLRSEWNNIARSYHRLAALTDKNQDGLTIDIVEAPEPGKRH